MAVIELPDEQAAALKARAAGRLAVGEQKSAVTQSSKSVFEEMNALRARIEPDPEGWTTRDYVQHGRR